MSRRGIQINAQDPHIARTRVPVFIPLSLVHDIFMQQNINNVICIVYDELKSNMKGVLLYVVHPSDAHVLREDFRQIKQSVSSRDTENQGANAVKSPVEKRVFSPTAPPGSDSQRARKVNRQHSPRRILYVRDADTGTNKELTAPSALPVLIPVNETQFKSSYHSSRDDSGHRRHKSSRKVRGEHEAGQPASDDGSKQRRTHRSRSPKKSKPQPRAVSRSPEVKEEQENQPLAEPSQPTVAWHSAPPITTVPMGIYNR